MKKFKPRFMFIEEVEYSKKFYSSITLESHLKDIAWYRKHPNARVTYK